MLHQAAQGITRGLSQTSWGLPFAHAIRRVLKRFSRDGLTLQTRYQDQMTIWVDVKDYVGSTLYFLDLFPGDYGLIPFLQKNITAHDVFFDVGAYIGITSILAAQRATQGFIHSFEASQSNYDLAQRNIQANNLQNVRLNRNAIWHSNTTLDLFSRSGGHRGTFSVFKEEDWLPESTQVEAITIDHYVFEEAADIQKIDWLKIDIEGAELEALAGAQRTLETYRPKVIIEVAAAHLERAGHTPQSIFDFWERMGYHIFEITEDGAAIRLHNPQRIHEVDGLNLLCTPAEKPHDASVNS